jgi:hypothetical protein
MRPNGGRGFPGKIRSNEREKQRRYSPIIVIIIMRKWTEYTIICVISNGSIDELAMLSKRCSVGEYSENDDICIYIIPCEPIYGCVAGDFWTQADERKWRCKADRFWA